MADLSYCPSEKVNHERIPPSTPHPQNGAPLFTSSNTDVKVILTVKSVERSDTLTRPDSQSGRQPSCQSNHCFVHR